jgi:hypothetical protein
MFAMWIWQCIDYLHLHLPQARDVSRPGPAVHVRLCSIRTCTHIGHVACGRNMPWHSRPRGCGITWHVWNTHSILYGHAALCQSCNYTPRHRPRYQCMIVAGYVPVGSSVKACDGRNLVERLTPFPIKIASMPVASSRPTVALLNMETFVEQKPIIAPRLPGISPAKS